MYLKLSKYIRKCSIIVLHLAFFLLLLRISTFAQTMFNEKYNLNIDLGKETLSEDASKAAQNEIKSSSQISLYVSSDSLEFGNVRAGEPIKRTITLKVKSISNLSYQVLIAEDHSLSGTKSKTIIPDTTCDEGVCNDIVSSIWTSPLSYGLGFRCDDVRGFSCLGFFSEDDYREFPNLKNGKDAKLVMLGNTQESEAQITYKLNLAPTQVSDSYQNVTNYILTPSF